VKYVPPIYPAAARARGSRGVVIVEARIDEAGAVAIARVAQSVPPFDAAALAAVRQWRYVVTTVHGKPAALIVRIPVTVTP
jgi:protein TonB